MLNPPGLSGEPYYTLLRFVFACKVKTQLTRAALGFAACQSKKAQHHIPRAAPWVLSVYIEYARSNFVVYLYDILFISLFFIVIIYAFMV